MLPILRKAEPDDLHQLVTLMAEFYSESPYTLNPRRAAEAFAPLLADDRLGHVWFIQTESQEVGYVVVTFAYSMEYGVLPVLPGRPLDSVVFAFTGSPCVTDYFPYLS